LADKVTNSNTLNIKTAYKDTDTRIIKLKNPRGNITTSEITALETLIKNGSDGSASLLIGDKRGADFLQIDKVTITRKTTLDLDLGLV